MPPPRPPTTATLGDSDLNVPRSGEWAVGTVAPSGLMLGRDDGPRPHSPQTPPHGTGTAAAGKGLPSLRPRRRSGASGRFGEDVELRRRLRSAAALLLAAFAGFLARQLILDPTNLNALVYAGWPRWLVVGTLAGVVAYLSSPAPAPPRALAALEAVTFGVPGLFFLWVHQHGLATEPDPAVRAMMAAAYVGAATVPWVLLIQIYALFIPQTARRAVGVIGAIAVVPLLGAAVGAARFPELYHVLLRRGWISAMTVWLGVSAATAIWGAARLSSLRRDAVAARRLGNYQLTQRIAGGGMGEVYLAEHRLLHRPCAVKLIRPNLAGDDRALARFDGEVRAAARLTHPNTIEIYDFGLTDDGRFYCAMEYLPGLNLHDLVARAGPLPPGRAVRLLAPVCGALAEAHRLGLIHRDVKPANVIATERGGTYDVPKLLDFGLVKRLAPPAAAAVEAAAAGERLDLTRDGRVVGSPLFAAPEAATGEPTEKSDLYSLGATAYHLLTGRPPFDEPTVAQALYAHAHEDPVPVNAANPAVPADLAAVVMRCLEKAPALRPPSAAALGDELRACACAGGWTDADAAAWWAALAGTPSDRFPVVLADAGAASAGRTVEHEPHETPPA